MRYKSSQPVFTDRYYAAGEEFETDAKPSKDWVKVQDDEKPKVERKPR